MMALEFSRVALNPDVYLYKFPSFKILAEFFFFPWMHKPNEMLVCNSCYRQRENPQEIKLCPKYWSSVQGHSGRDPCCLRCSLSTDRAAWRAMAHGATENQT